MLAAWPERYEDFGLAVIQAFRSQSEYPSLLKSLMRLFEVAAACRVPERPMTGPTPEAQFGPGVGASSRQDWAAVAANLTWRGDCRSGVVGLMPALVISF